MRVVGSLTSPKPLAAYIDKRATDVVIIGAGQSGASASYWLKEKGVPHVLLDKATTAGFTWAQRWDSFKLNTPTSYSTLPGHIWSTDVSQDSFLTKTQVHNMMQTFVLQNDLPLHTCFDVQQVRFLPQNDSAAFGNASSTLQKADSNIEQPQSNFPGSKANTLPGSYVVEGVQCQPEGNRIPTEWTAKAVVIATGHSQLPRIPSFGQQLSKSVVSLHTHQYKNAAQLPPGNVLVVGYGQSGAQIAKDLIHHGRQVFLSVGHRTAAVPRRYRGKDIFEWAHKMGMLDLTVSTHPLGSAVLLEPNPVLDSEGSLLPQQMALEGVKLVGKVTGIKDNGVTLELKHDLPNALQRSLAAYNKFTSTVDSFIEKTHPPGSCDPPLPSETLPDEVINWGCSTTNVQPITELDLEKENITSIIWATGFARDYSWLQVPGLKLRDGNIPFVEPHGGVPEAPGLYFVGIHFMRNYASALLWGAPQDAKIMAEHVAQYLKLYR